MAAGVPAGGVEQPSLAAPAAGGVTLFLCGDVMTGRGVDQILAHPNQPAIPEPFVRDAREYVALAERRHGPVPRAAADDYVWGDALEALARARPDARIVNLETSITTRDTPWPGKGIAYRMHPANAGCLTAAGIHVCALANNHVMDYGAGGVCDTLDALRRAGIASAGAGRTRTEAWAPAVVPVGGPALLAVFAFGAESSGIPPEWAARDDRPGVALLPDLSAATARQVSAHVLATRGAADRTVVSVHWGGNWGHEIPPSHVAFARRLIDAGIDLVHGHSSHHPQAIEIYRDRLILYGCGDFIDDYEGIAGDERYRSDLVLMYLATLSRATGRLLGLEMTPLHIRRLRLHRAAAAEAQWLAGTLERVSARFGTRVALTDAGLVLRRPPGPS